MNKQCSKGVFMKKFKLIDVFNIYNILTEMGEKIAPLKVSYWISKNILLLKNDYSTYLKKRNEIWSQLLYENEDGTIVTKDETGNYRYNCTDDNKDEFISRMNELNDFEVEIEPFLLNIDELVQSNPSYEIEAKFLSFLSGSLITFGK
jgi:hypothetical protein